MKYRTLFLHFTSAEILFGLGAIVFNNLRIANSIQLDIHLPILNKTSCIYRTVVEANRQLNQWSSCKHTNEQIHFDKIQGDARYNSDNSTAVQVPHITLFLTDFALEEVDNTDSSSSSSSNNNNNITTSLRDRTRKINNTAFEELIELIQFSIEKELNRKSNKCYYDTQIQKPLIGGPYAMYETMPDISIQQLSNSIVKMTQKYVKKDQPIPDWVRVITDEEIKRKKIHYIKKYGSPNVFDEFDPHVTVGFDDGGGNSTEFKDDRFSILNNLIIDSGSCGGWIDEVRVGLVGDFGTVIGRPARIFYLTNFTPCVFQTSEVVVVNELLSAQQ